jgi:hypothetical protein
LAAFLISIDLAGSIDILITDLEMPGISGRELSWAGLSIQRTVAQRECAARLGICEANG